MSLRLDTQSSGAGLVLDDPAQSDNPGVTLPSVVATAVAGTLSDPISMSVLLASVAATAVAGSVTANTGQQSVTPPSVVATAVAGNVSAQGAAVNREVVLAGVSASAAVGSLELVSVSVALDSVAATAVAGSVNASNNTQIFVSPVAVSAQAVAGTIAAQAASGITLQGVAATAQVGQIRANGAQLVIDGMAFGEIKEAGAVFGPIRNI